MNSTIERYKTLNLHVQGIVQGVGFRPFIYRLAGQHNITGWVRNSSRGVEIKANGTSDQLETFIRNIHLNVPAPGSIAQMHIAPAINSGDETVFSIIDSDASEIISACISPDIATCSQCLAEINHPDNRRYRYPFTNCTCCGPRYSIMTGLPYDRDRTTMRDFQQCPECRNEYDNPSNRRFHAQPNACPVCGPRLLLWDAHGEEIAAREDALQQTIKYLRDGAIIAVKGLGGFHLMVDATNESAVQLLRKRKCRSEKPFAVMAPDMSTIQRFAHISKLEEYWLASPVAPILLLKKKLNTLMAESVSPGTSTYGFMLPYTPLHHLLMAGMNSPVVATSGNLSDEPLCIDEHEVLERLENIADMFLIHNRPIAHPIDDSVMRIVRNQPLIIRAARGLAPITIDVDQPENAPCVLGTGPHMKATLALAHEGKITVSPHIGDLETVPAWHAYERNIDILTELYHSEPTVIACDAHPAYATTGYARRKSQKPHMVLHHVAHTLAVMAEFGIKEPVLGITWDGTGFGDDGLIWGGEFLEVSLDGYRRVAHLRTFPIPGGDLAAREPWRSALGVITELGISAELPVEPSAIHMAQQAMKRNINSFRTSSAGRLFDAAAVFLGVCCHSSYEGQAPMMLESLAESYEKPVSGYPFKIQDGVIDWGPIMEGMLMDKCAGHPANFIAARFHQSMIDVMLEATTLCPGIPVVLAGGCFQNSWLLDRAVGELAHAGRVVYRPQRLPPNDGAISVGQAYSGLYQAEHNYLRGA